MLWMVGSGVVLVEFDDLVLDPWGLCEFLDFFLSFLVLWKRRC